MWANTPSIALTAIIFSSALLSAQEVNVRVDPIDSTARSRIQDGDQPDSASSSGSSFIWTVQQAMDPTPRPSASGPPQKPGTGSGTSQFPSLFGMSAWGPSWLTSSSSLNVTDVPTPARSVRPWTKANTSHKLNLRATTKAGQTTRLGPRQDVSSVEGNESLLQDEFSVEGSGPTKSNLALLRELKRTNTRSARLRAVKRFQAKADAFTGSWDRDASSARALQQQEHESGLVLQQGFNAQRERKTRHGRKRHGVEANAVSR